MQILSIKSTFVIALLVGCNWQSVEFNTTIPPQDQSISANKSSAARCDFSSYAPVRIEQFDRRAILKRVQPEYPLEAARRGTQGRVIVKSLVNEKGIVERACAIEGGEILRKAAEIAALQWKLKPGYGLAFTRPKTKKNPKNFAEVYIVFEFKIDKKGAKGTSSTMSP